MNNEIQHITKAIKLFFLETKLPLYFNCEQIIQKKKI